MPQAIVDPEQLRKFATALKTFSDELEQRASSLNGQMNQLSETWRDQQHRKFAAEFETELKQIGRLIKSSQEHIPYLLRKAEQVDAYLKG